MGLVILFNLSNSLMAETPVVGLYDCEGGR